MHDASKMLQIYAGHSHASLLSKEDKTTPKAWRRRHQWIRLRGGEWWRQNGFKSPDCFKQVIVKHIFCCCGVQMLIARSSASSCRDAPTCTALNGYV